MSETILRILLEELTTLRLVCKKCGTAVEFAVDGLNGPQYGELVCPGGCGSKIRQAKHPKDVDEFDQLAVALRTLRGLSSHTAQFVLPAKDAPKP